MIQRGTGLCSPGKQPLTGSSSSSSSHVIASMNYNTRDAGFATVAQQISEHSLAS